MAIRIQALLIAVAILSAGCTSRPHAPAIVNEAIYQNEAAGLRMQVPDGWVIHAKSALPAGEPVPNEKLLIGYKRHGPKIASFEVACADLPADADLAAKLTGSRTGPGAWRAVKAPEAVAINGVGGTRLCFEQGAGANANYKETVAVRRGPRVYFFTLVSAVSDVTARDEARRVVSTVTWKPD